MTARVLCLAKWWERRIKNIRRLLPVLRASLPYRTVWVVVFIYRDALQVLETETHALAAVYNRRRQSGSETRPYNMLESRLSRVVTSALFARLQSTAASAVPQTETKAEPTGLHRLQSKYTSPFGLFKEWYQDNKVPNKVVSNALTFSTSNKKGKLSSRTLILRRLDEDGFVIMTDKRSRKCRDLEENPYASMVFLWLRMNEESLLSRQVRVEGAVHELAPADMEELYEVEPLFCKIRAHICHQGRPVDWQQHKEHHDRVLHEWEQGLHSLQRPDHVVAYKLVPEAVEFYEAQGLTIGDRLQYTKQGDQWDVTRIAA